MVTFSSYFFKTEATFKCCKKPKRKPDYESASYSSYWYGEDKRGKYVIRYSHHWCKIFYRGKKMGKSSKKIGSCLWHLKFFQEYPDLKPTRKDGKKSLGSEYYAGKAYLSAFTKVN